MSDTEVETAVDAAEARLDVHPARFWLGREVHDVTTGMKGYCTLISLQPTGNFMLGVQPKSKTESEAPGELRLIDLQAIEEIGEGISGRVTHVMVPELKIGDVAEHVASPFKGMVHAMSWHLNGCVSYSLASPTLSRDGKAVFQHFNAAEVRAVKGKKNKAAADATQARTGGPARPLESVVR